jgi:hypothetical protein
MKRTVYVLSCIALMAGGLLTAVVAQSNAQASAAVQAVPVMDGGVGKCSVEFTVTTADGKPAAAATVKVHIAYGFGGFHKLDLQAGANSEGKVKFTGLPSKVRRSELEFEASKGEQVGTATVDPASECQAKREIKLREKSASTGGGR